MFLMVNGELIMKKAYKRTEIGVVPVDWEVKELGKIGFLKNGINKSKEDFGFGYPFVNLMDVFGKSRIKGNEKFDLINSTETERNLYNLKKDDVIFIRSSVKPSGVGLTTVIYKDLPNTVYSGFLIRFRENGFLNLNFKEHCFHQEGFRNRLVANSTVSANTNINQEALKKLFLVIPPLPEQKAIAEVLSDTDNLIQALEKRIAKKRLIKQGAMQKLLTPKEDWEVKKLGEIGECIIGLTYSPDNVRDSGKLVLRSSNIQGSVLRFDNNVFVDIQVPEKLIVKKNDILICVRNGSRDLIGKCALIGGKAIGETFGAFMSVFRSPFNEFVFIVFQSSLIKKQIDEHLGATINQITNKSLNSFEIPFPPKQEQTHIATILSDMDSEIEALEKKLAKYQLLKQGLMQNLLTGKIRLI
jgi:type I restriction enzyme S subunit